MSATPEPEPAPASAFAPEPEPISIGEPRRLELSLSGSTPSADTTPLLRAVLISDTHNKHAELGELPVGDVLIHAGDFTDKGSLAEITAFDAWIATQPHRHKLVIAGNHDVGPFKALDHGQASTQLPHCTLLDNTTVDVAGVRFYGSGWNRKRAASRKIPLASRRAPAPPHLPVVRAACTAPQPPPITAPPVAVLTRRARMYS